MEILNIQRIFLLYQYFLSPKQSNSSSLMNEFLFLNISQLLKYNILFSVCHAKRRTDCLLLKRNLYFLLYSLVMIKILNPVHIFPSLFLRTPLFYCCKCNVNFSHNLIQLFSMFWVCTKCMCLTGSRLFLRTMSLLSCGHEWKGYLCDLAWVDPYFLFLSLSVRSY